MAERLQARSTIARYVARHFEPDLRRYIERDVQRSVLARRLEAAWSRDQILEWYLNDVYLGRRAYGVAAASLVHFGKTLDELRLSEMAYLAALPRAPNNYHPTRNKDRAIERRNWVLDLMAANGVITREEADAAKRDDLVVIDRPPTPPQG